MRWVDAGRGLAIALVVLYHAGQWLSVAEVEVAGWRTVNDIAATLRMPLFFVMSGILATSWLSRPWSTLWRVKLSLFVWVFLLWSVLATGPFILGLYMQGHRGMALSQYRAAVMAPLEPRFELWFIWALALLFVLARMTRTVPTALLLSTAAVLSAVSFTWVDLGNVGWNGLLKYAFFFLLGLHCRPALLRLGRSCRWGILSALLVTWAGLAVCGVTLQLNAVPGYYFVTAVLGVVAGITISRVLVWWPVMRHMGAHTLPIYLAHTSAVILLAWVLFHLPVSDLPGWSGTIIVPTVAVLAIALSLGLHTVLLRVVGGRYVYQQPELLASGPFRCRGGSSSAAQVAAPSAGPEARAAGKGSVSGRATRHPRTRG